jgi:hypothetical protein
MSDIVEMLISDFTTNGNLNPEVYRYVSLVVASREWIRDVWNITEDLLAPNPSSFESILNLEMPYKIQVSSD